MGQSGVGAKMTDFYPILRRNIFEQKSQNSQESEVELNMDNRGYLARGEPRRMTNLGNTNQTLSRMSLIKSEIKNRWFEGETGHNRGSPPDGGEPGQAAMSLRRCDQNVLS